jgi:ribose-phosphate pyrophosphokinase
MMIKVFALQTSKDWGKKFAQQLGARELSPVEEIQFEDGEHMARPLSTVCGANVFVVQSLFDEPSQSIHDKLCQLLFFVQTLKDDAAKHITLVIPYLAYARKDRRSKSFDPITLRYVAQLIEAMGVDKIISMDVHNLAAYENAFRIPTLHVEASALFAPIFVKLAPNDDVVVVSPDSGGLKRAEQFRILLSSTLKRTIEMAFINKNRIELVVRGGEEVIGQVRNRTAIIIDDMISTGQTIQLAVQALSNHGVNRIFVFATHGLFVGQANSIIADHRIEKFIVTNSISPFRIEKELLEKVLFVDATPLFSTLIKTLEPKS